MSNKIGSKWNIGDLVTLSAAGKKADQNCGLLDWQHPSMRHKAKVVGFGMVVGHGSAFDRWPVRVQWFGHSGVKNSHFKDYELKRLKADKNCP